MKNPNEVIGCKECGEQTIAALPICNYCESFNAMIKTFEDQNKPELASECPKCGECSKHSDQEKMSFAYDALEEANKWDQIDATRGASRLKGKTIVDVDTRAINQIILTCSDGTKLYVNGEIGVLGIPVILIDEE